MSPATVPVLIVIGVFVAAVTLIAWTAARGGKRIAENVRQMAATLGFQFVEQTPVLGVFYPDAKVRGQLRGKAVEVFTFWSGSGRNRTQWSGVAATTVSSSELTFRLRRQGFGTKVLEFFGAQEIEVGDAEFDRTWFIQSNQPEFFRGALLPEVRDRISSLVRELDTGAQRMEIQCFPNRVRYAEMGSFAEEDVCKRCLRAADIVCDLADVAEVFAEQESGKGSIK